MVYSGGGVWQRRCLQLGPLTLRFNRQPFLKIDMRHGAYWYGKIYLQHDINLSLNLTGGIGLFKIDMEIAQTLQQGILPFQKIDMQYWGPPVKGPLSACRGYAPLGRDALNI